MATFYGNSPQHQILRHTHISMCVGARMFVCMYKETI